MNLVLSTDATREIAVSWLKQLVRDFGIGFHLDTRPEDYDRTGGTKYFSSAECGVLSRSLNNVFELLGDDLPYQICAEQASEMLAELLSRKPPLEYHDPDFQQQLLRCGSREDLITWLCWNDPNGIYSDEDSIADDRLPLELNQARELLYDQINRKSESVFGA